MITAKLINHENQIEVLDTVNLDAVPMVNDMMVVDGKKFIVRRIEHNIVTFSDNHDIHEVQIIVVTL